MGWLADRAARQIVLAVCVAPWSAATDACGLVQSFDQLLLATVAIALGEAALGPAIYSMVPDLFPGKSRITANLIYFGAVTVGAGFGVALSGGVIAAVEAHRSSLSPAFAALAAWRIAFFAVAAPGVLVAAAVMLIGPVARKTARVAHEAGKGLLGHYRRHWRAAGGVYAAGGFYGLGLYAIYAWTPVYIIRILKAAPSEVGYGIMMPMRVYQVSMVVVLVPILLQLAVTRPWQAYVLAGVQLALTTAGTAMTPTMLQDISPPDVRGRVMAIYTFFCFLVASVAPLLVGAVSDALAVHTRGLLWRW